MKKRIGIVPVIVLSLALTACGNGGTVSSNETSSTVDAEYPAYDTAQDLIDSANLIFSGTVKNVTYEMLDVRSNAGKDSSTGLDKSEKIAYTIYEISVAKIYKGSSKEETIKIKCPGGEKDGPQNVVEGVEELQQGKEYLFLTQTYENTYPSLLNVTQAAYDMDQQQTMGENGDKAITLSQILEILE